MEKSSDGRKGPSRAGERNAAFTREAIVEAAGELFTGSGGYDGTSVAEVAREAGVAVGTVYRHFADKTELLYAVKERWDGHFLEALSRPEVASVPHRSRIRPMMEVIFEEAACHVEMLQLMGMPHHLVGREQEGVTMLPMQRKIKEFLDEAIDVGAFRPIDTEAAAVISYGMVESALRRCFEVDGGKSRERYVDTLVDALERWVDREG